MKDKPKGPAKAENLHAGHRERMRARYKKGGMDAMADHEIIELLLYYAIPRRDTNKLAHRIMKEFGSLHAIFEADAAEIQRRCKLSENTATLLSMVLPMARRYDASRWGTRICFTTTKSLCQYVKSLFIGQVVECFYLLCLDNQLSLISTTLIERGTLNRAELYPREIMKCAISNNAAYVVLAHNHPGGSLEASDADKEATRHIVSMLDKVEISVLDHIICGGTDYACFSDRGILHLKGIDGIMRG